VEFHHYLPLPYDTGCSAVLTVVRVRGFGPANSAPIAAFAEGLRTTDLMPGRAHARQAIATVFRVCLCMLGCVREYFACDRVRHPLTLAPVVASRGPRSFSLNSRVPEKLPERVRHPRSFPGREDLLVIIFKCPTPIPVGRQWRPRCLHWWR